MTGGREIFKMDLSLFCFGSILMERDFTRLNNLSHLNVTDTAGG